MFHFKQFSVKQDKTAMKVGTDGVLLGAWVPVENSRNILDIGTGTGLIALMLAQRNLNARITAIDIDENAFIQAMGNISESPWHDRITVIHESLQKFSKNHPAKFDLIATNPPFFNNSLHAPDKAKSAARHSHLLPHEDLLIDGKNLLTSNGKLALILPVAEYQLFSRQAENFGFYENQNIRIFPTPSKAAVRIMGIWGLQKTSENFKEEIIIEKYGRHKYSDEYIALTREFYLNMA
ncbi:tRNA1(Val) (adenine(37)-N6)-methyltransferase [Alkalitalea saponilacus]|uniref:tRNA1(Val) (adenine(37)-N6)-methyltransferase n=1 Tax=Alkalitalea saponilacus TaxID=889453 RepID=A0A1T5BLP5_9BACT|nr:methyltransferase [Alkalitalea saponilacus]ASB49658.1 methyltransferase [Alkalitalea saponilacus]SKB47910.1 tRNA1Val (adenine37-N6)-methyltransferase [Alkalitalea saponilacus]